MKKVQVGIVRDGNGLVCFVPADSLSVDFKIWLSKSKYREISKVFEQYADVQDYLEQEIENQCWKLKNKNEID